jgi:hypothetical protein
VIRNSEGLAHSSRLSFRFPQCLSLRSALNTRSTCRFNAPQHADARHHGRAVELDNQQQGFYRGLPLLEILLGLRELLDVFGGVLEGDELATAGQGNEIVEGAGPGHSGQLAGAQALTYVKSTSINLMAGIPSYFSGSNPYLSNLRLAVRSSCDLN